MKTVGMKEFAEAIAAAGLKDKAAEAASKGKEALIAFAAENGFDLKIDEAAGTQALADDALDAVNGGVGEVIMSQEWFKWLMSLLGLEQDAFNHVKKKDTAAKKISEDLNGKIAG